MRYSIATEKSGGETSMPKKLTKERLKVISNYLENNFDETDTTTRGYTKYVQATPEEIGLEINYKPSKGASVKIGGKRIPIVDLDKGELQRAIDNFENIQMIGDELGSKSTSSTAKVI